MHFNAHLLLIYFQNEQIVKLISAINKQKHKSSNFIAQSAKEFYHRAWLVQEIIITTEHINYPTSITRKHGSGTFC